MGLKRSNWRVEWEIDRIKNFISNYCKKNDITKAVIGISGGLDSAVVSKLTAMALGPENVTGVIMPLQRNFNGLKNFDYNHENDTTNAISHCKNNNIPFKVIEIGNAAASIENIITTNTTNRQDNRISIGNIHSRLRMIILYDYSFACHGIVIGTDNFTESQLGYFTKYGDGGVDINPIGHLYKTEVYQIAKGLDIIQPIIETKPTAGLWDGQTDEDEIGMSYDNIDNILLCLSLGMNPIEIAKVNGYKIEDIIKIKKMIKKTEHKRIMPYHLEHLGRV